MCGSVLRALSIVFHYSPNSFREALFRRCCITHTLNTGKERGEEQGRITGMYKKGKI